jgi:ankyrin repeat protein
MDQKLLSILGGSTEHYPYALERGYPRIFATLTLLWDTPEIEPYFMKLMVNERVDREGFPPDVAAEIVHLSLIHAGQHRKDNKDDVWSPEARMFTNFDPLASNKNLVSWPSFSHDTSLAIQSLGAACNLDGFFRAASSGNVPAIRLFLEAGVHLETRNEDGWTILMSVVYNDYEELADLLIQKGARVKACENGGNTPLHWAAFAGRLGCCKLLVKHQAEVNARSNFGWTPLYQAVARNHMIVASFLIANGADINASAKDGQTPLHKAAATGSLELINLLLSHHADTSLTNQFGETPLILASKNNRDEAATILRAAI